MMLKSLLFGLSALTVIHAASLFQTPMFSCQMTYGPDKKSPSRVHRGAVEDGEYMIFNVEQSSQVRSYAMEEPIFISRTREFPGPFGLFRIESSGSEDTYQISNVGLDVHTFVDDKSNVVSGKKQDAQNFAIQQAGQNTFVIKMPDEDLVWTVDDQGIRSNVFLMEEAGQDTQRWNLQRMDVD
ncbi:hypothetical protein C8R43DRAFT_994517 [Mycena crocata]|nr:hypothetical protein C8R43DRAFT_994517 [Mycena crocata]